MIPIQRLLSRIRWDKAFARARFEIGYYDRIAKRVILVPLESLHLSRDDPSSFTVTDDDARVRRIPLHRVRIVYRNGAPIWQRREP